jgi:hypothetical protein
VVDDVEHRSAIGVPNPRHGRVQQAPADTAALGLGVHEEHRDASQTGDRAPGAGRPDGAGRVVGHRRHADVTDDAATRLSDPRALLFMAHDELLDRERQRPAVRITRGRLL